MNRGMAETAVVGACLVDPQAFWKIADVVNADDFRDDALREIFEQVSARLREGKEADAVTIAEMRPHLERAALDTAHAAFSPANVRAYAELVLSDATQRRVTQAGQRISKLTGSDCLGEAQRILATCQPRAMSAAKHIREFVAESRVQISNRFEAKSAITGVPTSLDWLDDQTSGWQPSDLIVLAARPSVGKTALAIQSLLHAADMGTPGYMASLEQSGAQIVDRSLSALSAVPLKSIMHPKAMTEEDWPKLTAAQLKLAKLPITIDQTSALSVDAICARVRQANATQRLGLVVIDYLTQITPPRADKVTDGIQVITRSLKALAKELAVPVILLSQLNRDGDERPKLKHLRDSGAIEQDADVVLFLHRPDEKKRHLIELIVAKQRNGPCESNYLNAQMERMKFFETTERPTPKAAGFGKAA